MTKKMNKGSKNQNSPDAEFAEEITSGDNSKGNKRNKAKHSKNDRTKLNEDAFRKNRD
ncbi:hypothetical protein J27TS8_21310 [Robertmurraya siralis]|jgi:hypothetical protein|uniref:Uncharacterized protein n=1 Tax=Robertmurraya siralis TaxID=77777 RepID=A0A919WHZ4_9BACI|nr:MULTISPECIES: hypothetical protein [Robertmurraya]MDF1510742.1 hypothetical protein [Robertmurraya sp. DFI.2.37]GIN62138.1 hypothetical protein J27TS8_21310 [Robertmurraya siralis]